MAAKLTAGNQLIITRKRLDPKDTDFDFLDGSLRDRRNFG